MKFLAFVVLALGAEFNWAGSPCSGVWRTENQQADIQFVGCGEGYVCGVVVRTSKEFSMANLGDTLIQRAHCAENGTRFSGGRIRTNTMTAEFNAVIDSRDCLNVEITKFLFSKRQRWKKVGLSRCSGAF